MNSYFHTREQCPCCLSNHNTTVYQLPYSDKLLRNYFQQFYQDLGTGAEFKYLDGVDYIVRECNDCGALFQMDVPGPELMERIYEHWLNPEIVYKKYQLNRPAQYFRNVANQIASTIDASSKRPADVKFLDFGMGWSNWTAIAKGFGCDVYGTEYSEARIKNAKRLGIKAINPEEIQDMKFDVINIEQVLEHLVNPSKLLMDLRQALNKNGILRVGVPMCANLKHRLSIADWGSPIDGKNSLNHIAPLQHINFFSGESLLVMGRMAELEMFRKKNTHQTSIIKRNLRNIKHRVKDVKKRIEDVLRNGQEGQLNVGRVCFCHATSKSPG